MLKKVMEENWVFLTAEPLERGFGLTLEMQLEEFYYLHFKVLQLHQ